MKMTTVYGSIETDKPYNGNMGWYTPPMPDSGRAGAVLTFSLVYSIFSLLAVGLICLI